MKPNERTEPPPGYPTRPLALSHIPASPSSHSHSQPCGNHGDDDARAIPRVLERHGCSLPSVIFAFLHHAMQRNSFVILFAACYCVLAVVLGTRFLQGGTRPQRSRGLPLATTSMRLWINPENEIQGPPVSANPVGPQAPGWLGFASTSRARLAASSGLGLFPIPRLPREAPSSFRP
jgi:hypothetical protein